MHVDDCRGDYRSVWLPRLTLSPVSGPPGARPCAESFKLLDARAFNLLEPSILRRVYSGTAGGMAYALDQVIITIA